MTNDAILAAIQEMVAPYGFKAELWPDIKRVCVRGDSRAYLPTVNLIGIPPNHEVLAQISTAITNQFEVGTVTLQLAEKTPDGIAPENK